MTGTDTLTPGVYCGHTQITGNSTATFGAGNYIFTGDLSVNGTITVESGAGGVTFFPTGSGTKLAFSGTADIGLEAPTTGPYAGFIVFGDRNNPLTGGPSAVHTMRGTVLGGYNGKIYLPGAKMAMAGTANGSLGSSDCTVLIADKLSFDGTPLFEATNACSDFGGGGGTGGVAKIVK